MASVIKLAVGENISDGYRRIIQIIKTAIMIISQIKIFSLLLAVDFSSDDKSPIQHN